MNIYFGHSEENFKMSDSCEAGSLLNDFIRCELISCNLIGYRKNRLVEIQRET